MTSPEAVIKKLQQVLIGRRPSSLKRLPRYFRYFDTDGNKSVSPDELNAFLESMGAQLTKEELNAVFTKLDKDGNGSVDVAELTKGLQPTLNEARTAVVTKYFSKLDKTGDEVISIDDMKQNYCSSEDDLQAFLKKFEVMDHKDGKVTLMEFTCYYACLGYLLESDTQFEKMVERDWKNM